jgi:RNase P subunit RPR2
MGEHADKHFLDVDDFEVARSVHRIVRAMHDGECPKCHALTESQNMRPRRYDNQASLFDMRCLGCSFTITAAEQHAAMLAFGPVMERNLEVFESWRSQLSKTKAGE